MVGLPSRTRPMSLTLRASRGWRRWAEPFIWIGMNPITLYVINGVVGFKRVAQRFGGGDVKLWCDSHIGAGAGHSVGEITAAVGSGVLTAEQAMVFVRERGRAMAQAAATPNTTLSATGPSSKPCSRCHRIPHVRQRS